MTESLRGSLLLAAGGLFDPNFRRTVVLIAEHTDEGAVGLVLNRPADLAVAEAAPSLSTLVDPGELLYLGGPVQREAVIVLAEFDPEQFAGDAVLGSIALAPPDLDLLSLGGIRRARVFAGYSGWGPGQLEGELEQSAWIIEPAQAEDVFTPTPDRLWPTVLRRKGGDFAMLALMPNDPSTN